MASANFSNLTRHLAKADIDFDTATFRVMLLSAVPSETNLDAWVFRSDVTLEIAATGGYATGGVTQPFTLDALDTTNNRQSVTYSSLVPGWNPSTFAAAAAIIYQNVGTAATDRLLHMIDFGGTTTGAGAGYNLTYTTPFYINR